MLKKTLCLILALVVLGSVLLLGGCRAQSRVTPVGDDTQQNDPPEETRATVAVPVGQLTLTALMTCSMSEWSEISTYTHTDTDATHAVFTVADTYGKECVMNVTYDLTTDRISEATLVYEDTVVDVLAADPTVAVRKIRVAMDKT